MSVGQKQGGGRPVSMAQVAKAAGVSQQTVSRVVNGASNVNEQTRERVRRAMDELGFRPSFAGRSLRSGRYHSVGLCLYNVDEWGNVATLGGIARAAREQGYAITMVEVPGDEPLSLADAAQRMSALPVDALIVRMAVMASDFYEFRPLPGLSTVLLSVFSHPVCSTVESDQYGCSTLVVDHLVAHGHREIRHVAGPDFSIDAQFREAGWREALEGRGLSVVEPLRGDWSAQSGYEAGTRLARDRSMTAVYVANDTMALGVIEALHDAGRRVPEDVSVVGVDDSLDRVVPRNALTTVRFDLARVGELAFDLALAGMEPGAPVQTERLACTLVERASVASR